MACLRFEFEVEAAEVAALLLAPSPRSSLRSQQRFWGGLFWHVTVDCCAADPSQAGLFLRAALPTRAAAPAVAAAARGAEGAAPPPLLVGARYASRQASASAAGAPVRLETSSVWPSTTSYGLAGIRGVPWSGGGSGGAGGAGEAGGGAGGEADGSGGGGGGSGGGWTRDGRLRFSVCVSSVL